MTEGFPSTALPPADVPPGRRAEAELLTITAKRVLPGTVVLAVRGEVDLCSGPLLRDALRAHLRHPSVPLVVDLTGVGFFGVAGLNVMVTAAEAAVAAGAGLCLVANSRPVLWPLTITGLDGMFDIHPNLTEALQCPGGGPAR
ncbi:STAS domain-containing protein [Amycolatopsis sp. YIM 10]|uniref:STAS domain-containing protein n=1 Tax=Amycolatopsis sp. YIM 10 TaxID=2653857 RepID=UPI00128FDACF|nr:STAS domain-containing protein [Amycolatopsis sp. YIM 10]QFU91707.1 Anti-sigma-B factor antagonist [Amycolatopsis sp. YIM 10]